MSNSQPATSQANLPVIPESVIADLDAAPPFETILSMDGTQYRLGWGQTTWPESMVPLYTLEDCSAGETDFAGVLIYGTHGSQGERHGYAHFDRHDPDDAPETTPDSYQANPVSSLALTDTEPLDELADALATIHDLIPRGKRTLPEWLAFTRHLKDRRTNQDAPVHERILGNPKIERSLFEWQEGPHEFLLRVENAIDGSQRSSQSQDSEEPVASLWGMHDAVIAFADRITTPGGDLRAYYDEKDVPRNR